jgi:hypothetical protein
MDIVVVRQSMDVAVTMGLVVVIVVGLFLIDLVNFGVVIVGLVLVVLVSESH